MSDDKTFSEKVTQYRKENQCSMFEAVAEVRRNELIYSIQTAENMDDIKKILLKMV